MRQVWVPRFGGCEVLEVRDAPDPTAGPGEVRIAVAAAACGADPVLAGLAAGSAGKSSQSEGPTVLEELAAVSAVKSTRKISRDRRSRHFHPSLVGPQGRWGNFNVKRSAPGAVGVPPLRRALWRVHTAGASSRAKRACTRTRRSRPWSSGTRWPALSTRSERGSLACTRVSGSWRVRDSAVIPTRSSSRRRRSSSYLPTSTCAPRPDCR